MFTLNGRQYKDIEITYNDIADLEDKGIDIRKLDANKTFSTIRAIIAIAFGGNSELAGQEIQLHIVNGGSFEDLGEIVNKAVENSSFFQALKKNA